MNREEFNARLKNIRLTKEEFSKIIGYSYSGVRRWNTVPRWVVIVLDHIDLLNSIYLEKMAVDVLLEKKVEVQKLALLSKKKINIEKRIK